MKALVALLLAIVVLGGGYYWYTSQQSPATNINVSMDDIDGMDMPTPPATPTPTTSTTSAPSTGTQNDVVKEFTVTGKNFSFAPAAMSVKRGDRVRITFVNESGTHDLRVDGYNVGTKVIQGGASETFEFVADKTGSFEYYCSIGQHREMGMKGTLTVTN